MKNDNVVLQGKLIVLNDDGNIPLIGGIPHPKKSGFVKTVDKSEWWVG